MTEDRVSQSQGNGITAIDPMTAMRWRCIGPPRGGRVVAVAGDPEDPAAAPVVSGKPLTPELIGRT